MAGFLGLPPRHSSRPHLQAARPLPSAVCPMGLQPPGALPPNSQLLCCLSTWPGGDRAALSAAQLQRGETPVSAERCWVWGVMLVFARS